MVSSGSRVGEDTWRSHLQLQHCIPVQLIPDRFQKQRQDGSELPGLLYSLYQPPGQFCPGPHQEVHSGLTLAVTANQGPWGFAWTQSSRLSKGKQGKDWQGAAGGFSPHTRGKQELPLPQGPSGGQAPSEAELEGSKSHTKQFFQIHTWV